MMQKLVFFAAFTCAAPAGAATFVTPPVDVAGGDTAFCAVQNLTDQTRRITTRMWAENPRVMLDEDEGVEIGPRATTWVMSTSEAHAYVYCEIEGASKKLRGYVGVSSNGTTQLLVPAVK